MSVQYDLTQQLIPNLDRHLALPLLDFLDSIALYPHDQLLQAKYDLLKETNMVTYVVELHREIHGGSDSDPAPSHFSEKEGQVITKLETLQEEAEKIMAVISNPEVVAALRQDKAQNLSYLEKEYGVTLTQIAALYRYGQLQYTIGNYGGAADYLYHFRVLSTDPELVVSSYWGKLASDVLEGSFDRALDELHKLKDQLDQKAMYGNPLVALQQRTWWLHWSLFVYFNHPQGAEQLVEHWLGQGYLNTLQTTSPYLLRYLVAALVISKRSTGMISATSTTANLKAIAASARVLREAIKEVVRAVGQESHHYSDPVTEFVRLLYDEVDFEGTRVAFQQARHVFATDFFLSSTPVTTKDKEGKLDQADEVSGGDGDANTNTNTNASASANANGRQQLQQQGSGSDAKEVVECVSWEDQWVDSCRSIMTEAYCRIHDRIDMTDLAYQLGLISTKNDSHVDDHDGHTLVDSSDETKQKSRGPTDTDTETETETRMGTGHKSTSMSLADGETWMVRLVRDARLDAKMDFKTNTVQMNHATSSIHQTVIERTKRLITATHEQASKLQAIAQASAPQNDNTTASSAFPHATGRTGSGHGQGQGHGQGSGGVGVRGGGGGGASGYRGSARGKPRGRTTMAEMED